MTARALGFAAWIGLAAVMGAGTPLAFAVTPSEVLADPALEARARKISAELRCMICQNQSIDDSDAELAHDLRLVVRQRLTAGDSDDAVLAYVVSRYGEFVLLRPVLNWRNALLWSTPLLLLLAGGGYMLVNARRRRVADAPVGLSEDELRRLDEVLREE